MPLRPLAKGAKSEQLNWRARGIGRPNWSDPSFANPVRRRSTKAFASDLDEQPFRQAPRSAAIHRHDSLISSHREASIGRQWLQ